MHVCAGFILENGNWNEKVTPPGALRRISEASQKWLSIVLNGE